MNNINFKTTYLSEYFCDYFLYSLIVSPIEGTAARIFCADDNFQNSHLYAYVIDAIYITNANNNHEVAAALCAVGAHITMFSSYLGVPLIVLGAGYELYSNASE
jgi:hypothetical protein